MFLKLHFPFLACLIAPTTVNAAGVGHPEKDEDQVKNRIVNGTEAEIGRYDYFARNEGGNCGGFLISPNIVLTAAHCNENPDLQVWKKGENVVVGSYNFNDQQGTGPDFIEIKEVIIHPEYFQLNNDYMLVVLQSDSSFQPVIIPENDDFLEPGDQVYAIGMGIIYTGGPFSDPLLEVGLNYIENDECNPFYGGYITDNMMCTFTQFKDACQGDSGGPLIKRGVNAEDDVVVGITSFGFGCATEYPGVFARVSSKYDWIKTNVEENGGKLASLKTPLPSLSPSETPTKSRPKIGKKKAKNFAKDGGKGGKKEKKRGKLSTSPIV
mmetsp:Transcript_5611/g.11798  ORF Transcript_5611/g.11798 Transcript_5611/m.11798 type:complete len:324 (-) Transcript_5611:415-1386(-)|eukprot:CAMPEP_0194313714 /NCGR_PEP_ID=MMETSP0171-20130528/10564_1 /TAXON_ID=218684 /ORGANISM="Corethron pennatum, Strain L29A3" /LENGTH=323 /DNA_ID=CAMNT_0039068791 /DNA_START=238 /DNA_END=1209 /DNA_ORIENTATION=+